MWLVSSWWWISLVMVGLRCSGETLECWDSCVSWLKWPLAVILFAKPCSVLFCSSLHPLFFNPAGSLSVLESLLGLRGFHPLLCLFSLLHFSSIPERKPGFYSLFSFPFPYFFCFTFFMTHLLCSISWLTFAFLFYFIFVLFSFSFPLPFCSGAVVA